MRAALCALPLIPVVLTCTAAMSFEGPRASAPQGSAPLRLPNQPDSLKFIVLGDSGTGEPPQYQLAEQLVAVREHFKFTVALLLGGNLHGSERPSDFLKKFETPYRPLLEAGVTFHAALGNEDSPEQRYYKNFNMQGRTHYSFAPRPEVQFLVLESSYFGADQVNWAENQLKSSASAWKIVYLHHPLYSSGRRHGSDESLRRLLEPVFVRQKVSVVFSAHDNFYERTNPQNEITYFVIGSSGKLERGGINRTSALTASGFDTDLAFLVGEIGGDQMHFSAVSRTGQTVDAGVVSRRK